MGGGLDEWVDGWMEGWIDDDGWALQSEPTPTGDDAGKCWFWSEGWALKVKSELVRVS